MKATIGNISIEGEFNEIVNAIKLLSDDEEKEVQKPEKTAVEETPKPQRKTKEHRGRKKGYAKEDLTKAIEKYKKGNMTLSKAMRKARAPNTYIVRETIRKELKKQGIPNEPRKTLKQIKSEEKPEANKTTQKKYQTQRKRMKFIQDRAKSLMKTYNYSFEKARGIACEDWNRKGKKIKVVVGGGVLVDEPQILTDNTKNKLLLELLKNAIANQGKLTYPNEDKMLGCKSVGDWQYMLSRVRQEARKILEYFNVKGKLEADENYHGKEAVIQYYKK